MKVFPTDIPGVLWVDPDVLRDARGFFLESYRKDRYAVAGIPEDFVQDNHSRSGKGTLRGLHAQYRRPQGKLIRVVAGEIYDAAVDIRRGSPTFGKFVAMTLSAENFRQLYIPPGFAHGFCVLSEAAEVEYKCTEAYDPEGELTLLWNDPAVGIPWPVSAPLLSAKDRSGKPLAALDALLPRYDPGD